jgi:hypothetical protein
LISCRTLDAGVSGLAIVVEVPLIGSGGVIENGFIERRRGVDVAWA